MFAGRRNFSELTANNGAGKLVSMLIHYLPPFFLLFRLPRWLNARLCALGSADLKGLVIGFDSWLSKLGSPVREFLIIGILKSK
jgi:hypothetical protein